MVYFQVQYAILTCRSNSFSSVYILNIKESHALWCQEFSCTHDTEFLIDVDLLQSVNIMLLAFFLHVIRLSIWLGLSFLETRSISVNDNVKSWVWDLPSIWTRPHRVDPALLIPPHALTTHCKQLVTGFFSGQAMTSTSNSSSSRIF